MVYLLPSFLSVYFSYIIIHPPSHSSTHLVTPSPGIQPSRIMMEELLSSRPGSQGHSPNPSEDKPGINFTMFLTMMSERLVEFDTEPELIEAFESFDENDTGLIKVEEMRKWLSEVGERMDQREVSGGRVLGACGGGR